MTENLPEKKDTKIGRPKKKFKFGLAKEKLQDEPPLTAPEGAELNRIFPEDTIPIAKTVYLLRQRLAYGKNDVAAVMGTVSRTLDPIFATIEQSQYLTMCIDDAISQMAESNKMVIPESIESLPYEERQKKKMQIAQEGLVDSIILSPRKIHDASLKDTVGSLRDIHAMNRLEKGQSTENRSVIIKSDPDSIKKDEEVADKLAKASHDLKQAVEENESKQ